MTVLMRQTRHVLPTTFASATTMPLDVGQPTPPPAQPLQAQPAVPAQSQSENAPTTASSTNSVNPWKINPGKRAPPKNFPPIDDILLKTKWPTLGDEAAAASASSSSNTLPYKKISKGGGKKNKKGDASQLGLVGIHLNMSTKHNVQQYPPYAHRGRGRGMGRGNGRKPPLRQQPHGMGRGLPHSHPPGTPPRRHHQQHDYPRQKQHFPKGNGHQNTHGNHQPVPGPGISHHGQNSDANSGNPPHRPRTNNPDHKGDENSPSHPDDTDSKPFHNYPNSKQRKQDNRKNTPPKTFSPNRPKGMMKGGRRNEGPNKRGHHPFPRGNSNHPRGKMRGRSGPRNYNGNKSPNNITSGRGNRDPNWRKNQSTPPPIIGNTNRGGPNKRGPNMNLNKGFREMNMGSNNNMFIPHQAMPMGVYGYHQHHVSINPNYPVNPQMMPLQMQSFTHYPPHMMQQPVLTMAGMTYGPGGMSGVTFPGPGRKMNVVMNPNRNAIPTTVNPAVMAFDQQTGQQVDLPPQAYQRSSQPDTANTSSTNQTTSVDNTTKIDNTSTSQTTDQSATEAQSGEKIQISGKGEESTTTNAPSAVSTLGTNSNNDGSQQSTAPQEPATKSDATPAVQQQPSIQAPPQQTSNMATTQGQSVPIVMPNQPAYILQQRPGMPGPPFEQQEIPISLAEGPFFAIDVQSVATGYKHMERDIGQIAVIDEQTKIKLNVYVKPAKDVVNFLYELTSLRKEVLDQYGMPEDKAKDLVLQVLPSNCVLVGHNIETNIQALGLQKGKHYRDSVDLSELWKVYNPMYSSYTKFSLAHEARCLLNVPTNVQRNAVYDGMLSIQLFHLYRHCKLTNPMQLQVYQRVLLTTTIEKNFIKRNPIFQGVCMGSRKHHLNKYNNGEGIDENCCQPLEKLGSERLTSLPRPNTHKY